MKTLVLLTGLLMPFLTTAQQLTDEYVALTISKTAKPGARYDDLPQETINRRAGNLFSNGPLANLPGAGYGGADASVITAPLHVIAVPSFLPKRLVDNFTVTDQGWMLDSVAFYEVVPNGDINEIYFNAYTIRIWDGNPDLPASKVIWGDMTTNRLTTCGFSNTYRAEPSDIQSGLYPVFVNHCSTAGLELPAGEYWIDWQSEPFPGISSYAPYIACGEILSTGNARSYDLRSNVYDPLIDETYPQGLPFEIFGRKVVPELDVKLDRWISPVSGLELGAAEQVSVMIKNNGAQAIQNIPLKLSVDDQVTANEEVSASLLPGDSITFTFAQTVDLSAKHTVTISVESILDGDEFEGNNSLSCDISHFAEKIQMQTGSATCDAAWFTDSGGDQAEYGNNENLVFTFFPASTQPNPRMRARLNFFDTERFYDSLMVFDGPDASAPLLGVMCGGSAPEGPATIMAHNSDGALTFVFHSDDTVTRAGWSGTVDCLLPKNNDLAAVNLQGDNFGAVGRDQYYTVEVKNSGNLPQDDYTVEICDENNQVFGQIQGPQLQFDEKAQIQVPVSFPSAGSFLIFGRVVLQNDEILQNNCTEKIPVQVVAQENNIIEIPDDNHFSNEFPLNPGFRSSLTEVIYFPDEMNACGWIKGISYKYKFWQNDVTIPVKIWMGTTQSDDLSETWIPSTDLQLVFQGDLSVKFGMGLVDLNLDEGYYYDGTSNLVVMVERMFSYTVYPGHIQWGPNQFAMHEDTVRQNRSRIWKTNVSLIHPENPRIGTSANVVPYTAFRFDVSDQGSLKGTIASLDGQPLQGVEIGIQGTAMKTLTAFDGSYIFHDLPLGEQVISASKYAWNDTTKPVYIVAAQQQVQNLQLSQRIKASVGGMVNRYDDPEQPAAGAEITISGYGTSQTLTTDDSGNFYLAELFSNTNYRLRITYPGYQAFETSFFLPPGGLTLPVISLLEITAKPEGLSAEENGDVVDVSWDAGSSSYLIMYDDNTPDGQATLFDEGWAFAMRFTPLGYPCMIENVLLNIQTSEVPAGQLYPFYIEVYDDDGPDGKPGTLLGTVECSAENYGWNEFDLSGLNLMITDGEFYIAQRQTGPMDYRAILTTDNSSFELGRCYRNNQGTDWWGPQNFVKYMIRTWVNGPSEDKSSEGFNVYRLNLGQEQQPGSWMLLSENQTPAQYTDQLWNSLDWGLYRYAVKNHYTNGLLSEAALSDVLLKDAYCNLDIQLTGNAGFVPADVEVDLTRLTADTAITLRAIPSAGHVEWNGLIRGTYLIEISGRLFEQYTDTLLLTEDYSADIELQEKAIPPYQVSAEDMSSLVNLSWLPGPDVKPLVLDDGWPEGDFSSNEAMDAYFGNLYHHQGTNPLIDAWVYFEFNPDVMQTTVHLDVFDGNRQWIGESQTLTVIPEAWNRFVFDNVAVSGDFYVMVHFANINNPHYACFDRNGPNINNQLSYASINGEWMLIENYIAGIGDGAMLIRPSLYTGQSSGKTVDENNVYRLMAGEENNPANWNWIGNTPSTEYSDPSWDTTMPGSYRYAVKTQYTSGPVSEAAFSQILEKPYVAKVVVNITTNTGEPSEGTQVMLTCNDNDPQHIYTAVAGPDGQAVFDAVWKGDYLLEASLHGFSTYYDEDLTVISDACLIEILLEEAIVKPIDAEVLQQDQSTALFTWNMPTDATRQLQGFYIYLDNLNDPLAYAEEEEFLFEGLELNTGYTAGVSAVYSTGESEISTTAFILLPVGTGEPESQEPVLIPVVTDDRVVISLPEPGQIEVMDAAGHIVISQKHPSGSMALSLGHLQPGLYLVRIFTGSKQYIRKVILK